MLIKKRGRVPASDSLVVKRIAGPGLASNYFYQASLYLQVLTFIFFMSLFFVFLVPHPGNEFIMRRE
jgi:hypothetical protein